MYNKHTKIRKGNYNMTAKTELTRQLLATFAAGTPTAEELDAILKGYIIFKENDEQRSDLKRRIKHYLAQRRLTVCPPERLQTTAATLNYLHLK